MTISALSLLPSSSTLFAIVLAVLSAYIGKILSDSDRLIRNVGAGSRWRRRLSVSVHQKSIPEDIGRLLLALLQDFDVCRNSHFNVLPVAFFFMTVDTLAYLAAPGDLPFGSQEGFVFWIKNFLDPDTGEYSYPADALYALRCKLFGFSAVREPNTLTDSDRSIQFSPDPQRIPINRAVAVQRLSVPSLMTDLEIGLRKFAEALQTDQRLAHYSTSRWPFNLGLGSIVTSTDNVKTQDFD